MPAFTWFGFRYFEVVGSAEVLGTRMVHSNVAVTAEFECDNEDLNWMFKAFVNTQLSNMHAGIPSDCPHIERRGYTGDGQLICHAAMDILDARAFYHKWIADIGDCQDTVTGHVQYTAPYTRCGGGPGGWGCAIVEVPWQYYLHYGDIEPAARLYPQMLRYFDFLE
jgi:alpha-L-rhamnosidase